MLPPHTACVASGAIPSPPSGIVTQALLMREGVLDHYMTSTHGFYRARYGDAAEGCGPRVDGLLGSSKQPAVRGVAHRQEAEQRAPGLPYARATAPLFRAASIQVWA
jgi:hypothetical protein